MESVESIRGTQIFTDSPSLKLLTLCKNKAGRTFVPVWSKNANSLLRKDFTPKPALLSPLSLPSPIPDTPHQQEPHHADMEELWSGKRYSPIFTGTVDQELLVRNEYLVMENRILRNQITGRGIGIIKGLFDVAGKYQRPR